MWGKKQAQQQGIGWDCGAAGSFAVWVIRHAAGGWQWSGNYQSHAVDAEPTPTLSVAAQQTATGFAQWYSTLAQAPAGVAMAVPTEKTIVHTFDLDMPLQDDEAQLVVPVQAAQLWGLQPHAYALDFVINGNTDQPQVQLVAIEHERVQWAHQLALAAGVHLQLLDMAWSAWQAAICQPIWPGVNAEWQGQRQVLMLGEQTMGLCHSLAGAAWQWQRIAAWPHGRWQEALVGALAALPSAGCLWIAALDAPEPDLLQDWSLLLGRECRMLLPTHCVHGAPEQAQAGHWWVALGLALRGASA